MSILLNPWFFVSGGIAFLAFAVWCGLRVIGEAESGLVIKRFGRDLGPGRIIALDGEAGYQARMLPPGWHFPLWRWRYKVEAVPVMVVPPGQIALVVAADGAPIPAERVLGCEVSCDKFQDADGFLRGGGERGRQLGFLTAGTYRINPALFEVVTAATASTHGLLPTDLLVQQVGSDRVGIVTALDGRPIATGDLAGPIVHGHESFQHGQAFMDAGGSRGLQEDVLLSGAWNLNPWFVHVELIALTEIPIGYVGVVVSYVGGEHLDVTGAAFSHGDLVERGRKGVWVEPLLPGKHPLNTRVMKVELVPTTNIVLNWASRTEAHHYDQRLSSINVRSRDGFSFSLDVATIIHIGMNQAPRVISRVGSMQNLVDHVLQPVVGNYFRNSAQRCTVLEFLSARTERQTEAYGHIRAAISAYDVECIDTLVGDIVPPAELMKTQTDRKIAEELQRTYETQQEAEVKRQALARETAVADMQGEVVRSQQMVQIAQRNAESVAEAAKGEALATRARAEAEGAALRSRGEGEAAAVRSVGAARAEAYRLGRDAMGQDAYVALQVATTLGENHVKLVPDVSVTSEHGGSLVDVLIARMIASGQKPPANQS